LATDIASKQDIWTYETLKGLPCKDKGLRNKMNRRWIWRL